MLRSGARAISYFILEIYMKTVKPFLSTLILGLCAIAFSAQSQTSMPTAPSSSNMKSSISTTPGAMGTMSKEQIKAKYLMDKEECMSMNGNAKDMCMKKAKNDSDQAWERVDPKHKAVH
ncbi:hypothetical protein EDC26_102128 [Paralcaligenes ureilyticus]|uniref:Uncharacterized protein n=2 Tax=Paralcaligenes ureilyticus TaxID=627131 RepID=A0A4R3MAL2_9BURK|nr:hypothetical protein EDC26_102128 [Paralcaligenes ureilyticus]